MAKVFISYRHADSSQIVGRIDDRLEAAFGRKNVFRDLTSIHAGANFVGNINEAINQTDVALVIIGKQWVDITDDQGNRRLDNPDDFVRREVEAALNRDGCRTIPVLVNGAHMPGSNTLPDNLKPLALRNAMSVRDDPDFRRDMERVIAEIKTPSGFSLPPITARVSGILNSPLMIAFIGGLFVLGAAFLASWLPPYLQAQQQNGTATAQVLILSTTTAMIVVVNTPTVTPIPPTPVPPTSTSTFTLTPITPTNTTRPTLTLTSTVTASEAHVVVAAQTATTTATLWTPSSTPTNVPTDIPSNTATDVNTSTPFIPRPAPITDTPMPSYPCHAKIIVQGAGAFYVVHSNASSGSPLRDPIQQGIMILVMAKVSENIDTSWYQIGSLNGVELGWIDPSFLILSADCPK